MTCHYSMRWMKTARLQLLQGLLAGGRSSSRLGGSGSGSADPTIVGLPIPPSTSASIMNRARSPSFRDEREFGSGGARSPSIFGNGTAHTSSNSYSNANASSTFPSPPPSSPPRTNILSRGLGSMKRWRSRRMSSASQDVSLDTSMDSMGHMYASESSAGAPYLPPETPEPVLRPTSPTSARNWRFGSRASASPVVATTPSSSRAISEPPPSPDAKRSTSRPPSRYGMNGRKRSTTVDEVVKEEDTPTSSNFSTKSGKGKDVDLAFLGLPPPPGSVPNPPRATLQPSRRPLSLQPQSRPPTTGPQNRIASSSSTNSWLGSMGRATSNPFISGSSGRSKSKENIIAMASSPREDQTMLGVGRSSQDMKRNPSSGSRRLSLSQQQQQQQHKRSISLTSDPDDTFGGRKSPTAFLGSMFSSDRSPPPPVPPIPSSLNYNPGHRHASSASASSMGGLLPPISLSPPSPPQTKGRSASSSGAIFARPSTPPPRPQPTSTSSSNTSALTSSPLRRTLQHQPSTSSTVASSASASVYASANASANGSVTSFRRASNSTKLSPLLAPAPTSPSQTVSLGRGVGAHVQTHLRTDSPLNSPHDSPHSQMPSSTSNGSGSLVSPSTSNATLRRSSLGDLKIPARISLAQTGLRNNLGMLKEFANKVEGMCGLQCPTYHYDRCANGRSLLSSIQTSRNSRPSAWRY